MLEERISVKCAHIIMLQIETCLHLGLTAPHAYTLVQLKPRGSWLGLCFHLEIQIRMSMYLTLV